MNIFIISLCVSMLLTITIILSIIYFFKNIIYGFIIGLSYYIIHHTIYFIIINNLSYDYKYVGDGYVPNINKFENIIIGDSGLICTDDNGVIYINDNIIVDKIEIIDSLDLFTIEYKNVVMSDKFTNKMIMFQKHPTDSTILYIPKNVNVIKL